MKRTLTDLTLEREAVRQKCIRDRVREYLDEMRQLRSANIPWDSIAAALAEQGICWTSGKGISGPDLCRMVGEIDRVDGGSRRPRGRPPKHSRAAVPEVEPLHHPASFPRPVPSARPPSPAPLANDRPAISGGLRPEFDDLLHHPEQREPELVRPLPRLRR